MAPTSGRQLAALLLVTLTVACYGPNPRYMPWVSGGAGGAGSTGGADALPDGLAIPDWGGGQGGAPMPPADAEPPDAMDAGIDLAPPPDLAVNEPDQNPPEPPRDVAPEAGPPDLAVDLPVNLAADLIGYWKFDETAGTMAADSSNNGRVGRLDAIEQQYTWVANGHLGGALLMPADVMEYASGVSVTSDLTIRRLKKFTISAWTLRTTFDMNRGMSIMSRQVGATNGEVFNFDMDGATVRLFVQNPVTGVAAKVVSAPISSPLGDWIHVAATYDGKDLAVYVRGELAMKMPYAEGLIQDEPNPLYLGTNKNVLQGSSYHAYWEGQLDEVLLYSVDQDAATIRLLSMDRRPGL